MFSENYTISDKHSLTKKEYVSTLDRMPWRFTSLYDSRYLPELSETVSESLKSFFTYRFPHPGDEPIIDARKILIIEHVDGEIQSYDCRTEIGYHFSKNIDVWNNFIHSINCEQMNLCKPKMDKITGIGDEFTTKISGVQYDKEGSFSSITLYDSSYDLQEYFNNDSLVILNNLCKEYNGSIMGTTTFFPEINKINFKTILNYPVKLNNTTGRVDEQIEKYREKYLEIFHEYGLIDEDQASYIRSLLVGKTKFELEFVIGEDEQVDEIFVHHYKIYEFKDLTTA